MFSFAITFFFFFLLFSQEIACPAEMDPDTMRSVEACVEKFSNREGLEKMRISKQIIIVHFLDFRFFVQSCVQIVMYSG